METLRFNSQKVTSMCALAAENSLNSWQNDSKTLNKDIIWIRGSWSVAADQWI